VKPPELSQSPKAGPAGDAGRKPTAKDRAVADATASLAPFHTHFAHRPDWQTASDDEADAERDRSQEG
jgi:hypothetical protein